MDATAPEPTPTGPGWPQSGAPHAASLSELLSALSYALDLTEGQPEGHTLRSCAIGMRVAADLNLDADARSALYYALLLKDAGCSSNSAAIADLYAADDQVVKQQWKVTKWDNTLEAARYVYRNAAPGKPIATRLKQVLQVAHPPGGGQELFRIRCERGAEIARQIGFPDATADAIRSLDEHWNGRGYPERRAGEEIPLLARIAGLAQTMEVFLKVGGPSIALEVAAERSGTWFDPKLAALVQSWSARDTWWIDLQSENLLRMIREAEPGDRTLPVDDTGLDTVAAAFAQIIDAKSPFTYQHSSRVAEIARRIAAHLGLPAEVLPQLYRAGLLHDIGKLGVSNRILDKPGKLDPEEWKRIQQHPSNTWAILKRVNVFAPFATMAAVHHERLDGTGYPWGLKAEQLDLPAQILAVADVYEALTADRPYRDGMQPEAALGILQREAGTKVSPEAVEALQATQIEA